MPYTKKRKYSAGRRAVRNRRARPTHRRAYRRVVRRPRRGARTVRAVRAPSQFGFPPRYSTKLKYQTTVTLPVTTGIGSNHIFALNGVYDPDITNVVIGGQPRFFDQLSSLYRRYQVHGASMSMAPIHNTQTDFQTDYYYGFCFQNPISEASMVFNDYREVDEYYNKSRLHYRKLNAASETWGNLKAYCSTMKCLGLSKSQWADNKYAGTDTTNPASDTGNLPQFGLAWINLFAGSIRGNVSDESDWTFNVDITYYVTWSQLKGIGPSMEDLEMDLVSESGKSVKSVPEKCTRRLNALEKAQVGKSTVENSTGSH